MKALDELLHGIYSTTVTDVTVLVREVRVRVGVLSKSVTIRIYYDPRASEPYSFELSATMKSAGAASGREEPMTAQTEGDALRRAIRTLTRGYEEAVRSGELPDDSWLVDGPP